MDRLATVHTLGKIGNGGADARMAWMGRNSSSDMWDVMSEGKTGARLRIAK